MSGSGTWALGANQVDTWDATLDAAVLGPCMNVFGRTITYTAAASGLTQVIAAVYDEQFLSLPPLGQGPFDSQESLAIGAPGSISTTKPVIGVQLSQFTIPPKQGDRLSVQPNAGPLVNYVVREVQPDGHGAAKLTLKRVL